MSKSLARRIHWRFPVCSRTPTGTSGAKVITTIDRGISSIWMTALFASRSGPDLKLESIAKLYRLTSSLFGDIPHWARLPSRLASASSSDIGILPIPVCWHGSALLMAMLSMRAQTARTLR